MQQLDPKGLKELIERESVSLIDVREPAEFALCRIEGSQNLPMGVLAAHLMDFELKDTLVTICHHGMRSHAAAEYLEAKGFQRVINLQGGIDAWAREVDPSMARY